MTTINKDSENVNTEATTDRPNAEDQKRDDDLDQFGFLFNSVEDLAKYKKYVEYFEKYSLLNLNGKTVIVSSRTDPDVGLIYEFKSIKDFHDYHRRDNFYVCENDRCTKKFFSFLWIESETLCTRYEYATFNVNPEFKNPEALNFWHGFVEPKKGDHKPFLDHIDKLIDGTKEHKDHLIKLLAYTVRYPQKQTGTSVALKGKQGCGKTTISLTLSEMCPKHSRIIDDVDDIFGFNDSTIHLKYFLMEESVWGGDKTKEGKLKNAITAKTRNIAIKHVSGTTIPNVAFYVFTSNEDWIVPIGTNDRRFNVFNCTDTLIGDREYFDKYYKWLEGEGKHYLVNYFMNEIDLTGFDPKNLVANDAKTEVKVQSLRPVEKYLYNLLSGELDYEFLSMQQWAMEAKLNRAEFFQHFKENSVFSNRIEIMEFSKTLGKIFNFPSNWAVNWKGGSTKPFYRLPGKAECQSLFAAYIGEKANMLFSDYAKNQDDHDNFATMDPFAENGQAEQSSKTPEQKAA
ncbi:DUF5906 domain-containing protein [Paraburkholderia sp. D15]|uniref:primase-helicase family protein n=1 Tax=Paraburkholderia sp. D15 TaxID=2880218 RepID=UPI0024783EB9|nr:primase-helicase family protein [Paraburkholderia sp. D15]WGS54421.1 DUF5906 domain-containing protein [Paraburkholderia sp. D15]